MIIIKRINNIKLKSLEQTRAFYIWQLKREESLTEGERSKYLLALKAIEKIIKEKEKSGEKKNPFLKPDGGIDLIERFPVYKNRKKQKKAVFQNSKRGY